MYLGDIAVKYMVYLLRIISRFFNCFNAHLAAVHLAMR